MNADLMKELAMIGGYAAVALAQSVLPSVPVLPVRRRLQRGNVVTVRINLHRFF